MSRKIVVILGPTASGKKRLAVKLAQKSRARLFRLILDRFIKDWILAAAKSKKEMGSVPHYCIDIVSPKKIFTVVDFKKCANKAIEDIFAENKTPIIVGGTGLYIQAIVDNVVLPEVKPNWKLRKNWKKKTTEEMFRALEKLDPRTRKTLTLKTPAG